MKQFLVTLILGLVLCCGFANIRVVSATTEASKGDSGNINDFEVTMNSDGTLSTSIEDGDATTTWGTIFNKVKIFLIGFTGLSTLIFGFLFIKGLIGLGATADKPVARQEAIHGLLWTGIATAGCGSVTILVGLFWNAFK